MKRTFQTCLQLIVGLISVLIVLTSIVFGCAFVAISIVATAFGIWTVGEYFYEYVSYWGVAAWAIFLGLLALNVWEQLVKQVKKL